MQSSVLDVMLLAGFANAQSANTQNDRLFVDVLISLMIPGDPVVSLWQGSLGLMFY